MMSRRTGEYFGLALGAQKILDYACARGANRQALIERMQLGTYVLDDPDARLPTRCYYNLIVAASELLRDPWIGIHYLETAQPADVGAVGFAAISSETLGEAFTRVARYLAYLTESERIAITERDDTAHVEWKILGPAHAAHPIVSEMYAYDFTVLAARISALPIRAKAILFRHAPLQPLSEYRALFGCQPEFESDRDGCVLDQHLLRQPMPHANQALAAFFDKYLSERTGNTPELTGRIEREVLRCLCDGVPTLADLTKRLGMSARTLQRQLAAERASLRGIIDNVRRSAALQHLTDNMPLTDIGYLLGFRDTRSFFRAFKRWTGTTPLAWRSKRAGRKRA